MVKIETVKKWTAAAFPTLSTSHFLVLLITLGVSMFGTVYVIRSDPAIRAVRWNDVRISRIEKKQFDETASLAAMEVKLDSLLYNVELLMEKVEHRDGGK